LLMLSLATIPATASDYTLGVFGNANEDDTINMQDVTYTELIILEYKDATELADAKYDNRINMQDVTQIELVILGKEKELTVLDSADRTVTVNKPLERTVVLSYAVAEATKIVKADERIVGVSSDIKTRTTFFPELSGLPSVGVTDNPDLEMILELNPDIVCTGRLQSMGNDLEEKLPDTIAVTCWDMGRLDVMQNNVMILGYLLDKREEAEQFCNFYQEYIDGMIGERLSDISESDKKRVYIEHIGDYMAFTVGSSGHEICVAAGGMNIAADLPDIPKKPIVKVDPEWLVEENPDVIVKMVYCSKSGLCGYCEDDPQEMKQQREDLMNRSGWEGMTAVTSGRVYMIDRDLFGSTANFVGATYMAKWLYPNLFDDLDPEAFHQEYLTEYQRLDYDLSEHGVFVYPPLEEV
ncbi:MAG: ABC transporter substrate-binding protein, partial [Desulfobacterales bacterium]|nr:ABC transporter substrate-binding protein [Desulfobacterales bacterium]